MEKRSLRLIKRQDTLAAVEVDTTPDARMDAAYQDIRMEQLHARIRELCQQAQELLRYPLREVPRNR